MTDLGKKLQTVIQHCYLLYKKENDTALVFPLWHKHKGSDTNVLSCCDTQQTTMR